MLSHPRTLRLSLAALALVAACGGADSITKPPTPPKGPVVARIVYRTPDAYLFTGKAVPVSALVTAYDSAGHELPSSTLTIALSSGWTVRGDSVVAPAHEVAGGLLKAYPATVRSSAVVAASGLAPDTPRFSTSGTAPDSTALTAMLDMRAFAWAATFRCAVRPGDRAAMTDDAIYMDSLEYHVHADTVAYPGDGNYVPQWSGEAQISWSGTATEWLRNGETRDSVPVTIVLPLRGQAPDSLVFDPMQGAGGMGYAAVVRPDTSSYVYRGPSMCNPGLWLGVNGPTTVTGTKK